MMIKFSNETEKVEFLKKYKLISKSATDLPVFYYFKSFDASPIVCEIIGYDAVFDDWAIITIMVEGKIINIHSSYLSEMRTKGTAFHKNNSSILSNKNASTDYVVIDFETTGRNHKKDEIIEISAIKCINNKIYEFSELIKIQSIVPIDVSLLTGITNEMLYDAEPINIVFPKFLKFIGNLPLVGHNIKAFDIYFINDACHNLNLPEIKNNIIDTYQLSKTYLPDLANHRLSTICNFYGVDNSHAHRALADCYMCNECYKHLSVFKTDIDFQETLSTVLENIIIDLELPKNGLIMQSNNGKKKKTSSVYINEPPFPATKAALSKINTTQSILNFEETKEFILLIVSENAFNYISLPGNIRHEKKGLSSGNFVKVYFPKHHSELYTYIKNIICYRVKNYISSAPLFGCCNKFIECSDAKKCVHENKLYSTACMYRMNLDNGKIFYGKNRNID